MIVAGLGSSGRAAAELLARLGARVIAFDDEPQSSAGAATVEAEEARARVGEAAAVVASPGVAATHPVLEAAVAAAVPVWSEIELAARHLQVPLLAVSGTNGKSTTATLLARMLEAGGRSVFLGGNIGNPLTNAVGRQLDCCVVEVSSFQLEWIERFRPSIATILNLTPDHLDRHGDMGRYRALKWKLLAAMDSEGLAVLGRDQGWWRGDAGPELRARLSTFGRSPLDGLGLRYDPSSRTLLAHDGWRLLAVGPWPATAHDFENLAAAAEMARLAGVHAEAAQSAVADFEGLPHRLRLVARRAGLEFWNDSKATNPGAALRSIEALGRPIVLLAGGVGKGADFTVLARAAGRLRRVVAYGESSPAIRTALEGVVSVTCAGRLAEAFRRALGSAEAGDAILLAPACASFDEFSDYAERGRCFEKLVAEVRT